MTGRIPISEARRVAVAHGLRQVVLLGWDGAAAHVVTYGVTKADCAAAARAQAFWTGRIREFSFAPLASVADEPTETGALVAHLRSRIAELAPDAQAMREQRAKAAARVRKWRGAAE